jgi:predicted RNase H-like HicB family nuclease
MKRKVARRASKASSRSDAGADARRRLRAALATLGRRKGGRSAREQAIPLVVVRAQRRLDVAREKANAAAKDVEDKAYDALSVLVKKLRISMRDAGAFLGYPFIEIELLEGGRWMGEIPALPDVVIYAKTREQALAKIEAQALRFIADEIERGDLAPPGALFPFERGLFKRIEREKQASRDADARDLATGRKTPEQLHKENALFHGARVTIDYSKVKHPR